MLKLIIRLIVLVVLGLLAYDIAQVGNFQKSQTYRFLEEKEVIKNGELLWKDMNRHYNTAKIWAEKNIPVYYNETSVYLKPFLTLGQDLSLVLKSNVVSFIQHAGIYFDKNFPVFQNYVSIVVNDTITLAKENAVVLSQHLQNYTEAAVQFANNLLSKR